MEEEIMFSGKGLDLEGLIACPPQATAGVVLCHPHPLYGGDMHQKAIKAVAAALQAEGLATLRFNFRGVGRSQGAYDEGKGEVDDAITALDCLASRLGEKARLGLCGYSFGGMVACRVSAADGRVRALAGIAPVVDPPDVLAGWQRPKFFIIGNEDDQVPAEQLTRLVANMPEPKVMRVLEGAGHFFYGREVEVVSQAVTSFLVAHLKA